MGDLHVVMMLLKIEKPGAKAAWVGGIASAVWLEDHQIQSFSREKLFELRKKVPAFEVLALERLPRDSASPEDCSHVGALQVLVTAFRSKRPSAWTLFTS